MGLFILKGQPLSLSDVEWESEPVVWEPLNPVSACIPLSLSSSARHLQGLTCQLLSSLVLDAHLHGSLAASTLISRVTSCQNPSVWPSLPQRPQVVCARLPSPSSGPCAVQLLWLCGPQSLCLGTEAPRWSMFGRFWVK